MENKTKKVVLTIKGTQQAEGDSPDTVELETDGEYSFGGDVTTIDYMETELTGMKGTKTHFDIMPDTVTITRSGTVAMQMVFTVGQKNHFMYSTPFGDLPMCINTRTVKKELTDKGGTLFVHYELEADNVTISKNDIDINVREMEVL